MRRSPLVALLVGAGLVASLAGCSSGGASTPSKTISVVGFAGDPTGVALAKQFEKENPGVTIKVTPISFPALLTQENTQLAAGTAPDVLVVFPGGGGNPASVERFAKNGYLADLSDQSWTSGLSGQRKELAGYKGKVYLAPNNLTLIPAVYNSAALAKVGKSAPTTWSEVLDLCKAATAKGMTAYAVGAQEANIPEWMGYALTASLVYGPNPDFYAQQAAGKVSFSGSAGWKQSFQKMVDMRDAGCFGKNFTGQNTIAATTAVAKGTTVGTVVVSNQIAVMKTQGPANAKFVTAPFPATDDPASTYLPAGLGAGIGVNAKAKNLPLAKKFVNWYMSKAGVSLAVKTGGILPTIDPASYDHDSALDGVIEQAATSKVAAFPDSLWPNATIGTTFTTGLQKVLGNQASISSALQAMDKAYSTK